MKPLNTAVVVFALVGVWFVLQIVLGLLPVGLGQSTCDIQFNETFDSPSKTNSIFFEIKTCSDQESTRALSIVDPSDARSWVTFLEVPSSFTNASGQVTSPVSFKVQWNAEDSVTIFYPKGLNLEPSFSGERGDIRFEHFGVNIELRHDET